MKFFNIGSIGSFTPNPLSAVYGATKAYVLNFSEAIAEELQGTGITVTALCPGPTNTEFHKRAQVVNTEHGGMDARTVAEIGYRSLLKGKRIVIPGIFNKLQIFLIRFMSRNLIAKIVKNKKLKMISLE